MSQNSSLSLTGLLFVNAICSILQLIPWTSVFLLLRHVGIFLYIIKNKETCVRAQKRIQGKSSHTTDDGKGYGFSVGYWYIAYIDVSNNDHGNFYNMWVIGTEQSYSNLTASDDEILEQKCANIMDIPVTKSTFTIYDRTGSLHNTWYTKRKITMSNIVPYSSQETIMEKIKEHYRATRHTVVLLHGPPLTGKSMIGLLLANHYRSAFCNTMRPWQPGDVLSGLYSEIEPKPDTPLIVAFDEIDNIISIVDTGIPQHKNLAIQIQDKNGWNTFFDSIQRGLYPNVIFILTSNRSADYIRSIDSSYIREKRVDLVFNMDVTI